MKFWVKPKNISTPKLFEVLVDQFLYKDSLPDSPIDDTGDQDLEEDGYAKVPGKDHGDKHHLPMIKLIPFGQTPGWVQDESHLIKPSSLEIKKCNKL